MASSKKSLSDKFALEAKKKSPGKQSKKDKKAAKSLSRELQKPPATLSPKKKAQKSHSDSLVVGESSSKNEDRESESPRQMLENFQKLKDGALVKKTAETREEIGDGAQSQKQEESGKTDRGSVGQNDGTEIKRAFESTGIVRSTFAIGNISCPSHTIEKLEPSLKDTWHKPSDSPSESLGVFVGVETSTPKTSQTVKSSAEIHLKPRDDSVSRGASLLSVSSLSSAAESTASIDSISSELDTIIADDINIDECSSTSTPIKFTLHEDKPDKTNTSTFHRPPKFSLIREAKVEDHDNWSSSGLSPTNTSVSLKSIEGRNRTDDFSDDSDGAKLRESSEFSDDMQELDHRGHFVPLNKQLQIVTSMDRMTDR